MLNCQNKDEIDILNVRHLVLLINIYFNLLTFRVNDFKHYNYQSEKDLLRIYDKIMTMLSNK